MPTRPPALSDEAAFRGLLAARRAGLKRRVAITAEGEVSDPSSPSAGTVPRVTVDADGEVCGATSPAAARTLALLGPIALASGPLVIAQLAQTLDGFLATVEGESRFISGECNLVHLHRLRALADVVVVGRGTALADDPRLTVRRAEGPHPARAVLDRGGRVPVSARLFACDGARRLVLGRPAPAGVESLLVASDDREELPPAAIVRALVEAGLRTILIEGGGQTVTSFVRAGAVDRLHLALAPMFLGDGCRGISLPAAPRLRDATAPTVRVFSMAPDTLFECRFSRAR